MAVLHLSMCGNSARIDHLPFSLSACKQLLLRRFWTHMEYGMFVCSSNSEIKQFKWPPHPHYSEQKQIAGIHSCGNFPTIRRLRRLKGNLTPFSYGSSAWVPMSPEALGKNTSSLSLTTEQVMRWIVTMVHVITYTHSYRNCTHTTHTHTVSHTHSNCVYIQDSLGKSIAIGYADKWPLV